MFTLTIRANAVDIDAPVETAWEILIDVENYGEWNPFTPRVVTTLEVGTPVGLYVNMGRFKMKQPEEIRAVEPPNLLAWGMTLGTRFLLSAHREQRLQALGPTRCRYDTSDAFRGLLAPLVVLLFGRFVRQGFNNVAQALKERAETKAA